MRRISKKIMKSRVLIVAVAFSVFLSFTSFAVDSVNAGESANIKETASEIEELEGNLNKNTDTLLEEENSELSTEMDEEDCNTSEDGKSSTNEETVIDKSIIVDEEGNVIEEEVSQVNVDGEAVASSSAMLSSYGGPIPIYDENDLALFLNGGLGSNDDEYILMNDIEMKDLGPFRGRGGDDAFTGRFASEEGSQYTISNLTLMGRNVNTQVGEAGGNDIGFIRTAGAGAVIENVNFDRVSYVEPPNDPWLWAGAQSHIGLVVGRVTGGAEDININNINVTNSTMTIGSAAIDPTNTCVGGLIGSIEDSATVNITNVKLNAGIQKLRGTGQNNNRCGGLVGESAGDLTIKKSQVNVDITSNGGVFWHAGGVLARRTAGKVFIEDAVQNGNVQANAQAGGFVGHSSGAGSLTLKNLSTTVNKTIFTHPSTEGAIGLNSVGGMVGYAVNNTTITNCENHSFIHFQSNLGVDGGGLVGFAGGGITISDSVNYGNIDQTNFANHSRMAGILARTENNVTLTNVVNWGDITRVEFLNVDSAGDSTTNPNHNNNRLSSGILGSSVVDSGEVVRVNNAVNHGNMPSRIKLLAGIVGRLRGEGSAFITNSTNYGDMETYERAGGIVGRNELRNLTIDGCINNGKISAESGFLALSKVGGIISSSQRGESGSMNFDEALNVLIQNCGNRGEVVGNGDSIDWWSGIGGIAGWIANEGLVIENTYNIGYVRSTGTDDSVGGIIGHLIRQNQDVILRNAYSIGPVRSGGTGNGNGILGINRNAGETGALKMENVYVSAFFTGNAIFGSTNSRVNATNVYVDTSTAPTTVESRLQTLLAGINGATTEQLVSGDRPGLQGGPWMYGIAKEPNQRTLPYFAWQTGGKQQQAQFFHEIYSTNVEAVSQGVNLLLRGIASFPLTGRGNIDVRYSTEGYDYKNVRIFTPNNGGDSHSSLINEVEVKSILGTEGNIPSRHLTTGLISSNDVVGFDSKIGHRIYFDLNGGEQIDNTPLAQIISHGEDATVPEVEREGYVFEGWSTEPDGGGKQYSPEENIVVESGGTFYAKWTAATTTLTVAKEVTGEMGNLKQEFIFTIYFEGLDGNPLPENTELNYEGDTVGRYNNPAPNGGKLTLDENGCDTFRLAAGQAIRFVDVPATGCVQVVETPDELYMVSIIDSEDEEATIDGNDTTMLPMAKGRTFTFTNEREYVPPMGMEIDSTVPILMGVVSTAALAEFVFYLVNRYHRSASSTK